MTDSRQKGARAESQAKDLLRQKTGLKWERVPGSGALDAKHQLKGDLYLVGEKNLFCVEVKHYKDEHFNTSLFTSKNPQLLDWWQQAVRQAKQVEKQPLLLFKHDRSKWFAAFQEMPTSDYKYTYVNVPPYEFYVSLLEDYLEHENPKFTA